MFLHAGRISAAMGAGYITIVKGAVSCVSGGGYRLRVGESIQRYTNEEFAHLSITIDSAPSITEPVLPTGYACVPGAIYVVDSQEKSVSSIYNIMLAPTEEGILRGINILGGGMLVENGYDCKVVFSVVQPIIIKPNDYFAKLQFHQDPQQPNREWCCETYPGCPGRTLPLG